jgi:glycosyltransferase involved in cell wall biosynthesis
MKILFFNYEYPPLGAGAANATFYIMKEYSKIPDLEVDVVTASPDNQFHLEKVGENITIHKLPIGKDNKNLLYQSNKDIFKYSFKAYFYSKKLLRKNKYDLTHSFFAVPCGFISLVIKKTHKIPYVVSLRGADVPGYNAARFSLLYKLLTPLIKYIWKEANEVIANSEGLKQLALQSNPQQKIGIIFNGIDFNEFIPKNSFEVSSDKFQIISISRLVPRRGLSYLVSAVELLYKKYPQIYLKIVGEGDQRDFLENQIREAKLENHVELTGRVDHEEIAKLAQDSQVFALVPVYEGMSNAMLEAVAIGLPIIATSAGGTDELVQNGVNGFVVKAKNSADIAEKLEKLIDNPKLNESMGRESRKIAEKMSWDSVAQKYFEVYEKVAKKY